MIIDIPEMIDLLEKFVNSSQRGIIVGGMVGTEIEKYVLDAALMTTEFSKILIINGCQDYIGLMKTQLPNVKYWGDLFYESLIDSAVPYDPWKPRCMNPSPEYWKFINPKMLNGYEFIIFLNMHLVQPWVPKNIVDNFNGQIRFVCDPFESSVFTHTVCTGQSDIPVICDSLRKVSPMIAMARYVYEQPSRGIDTRISGNLVEIKRIQKKTIATKTINHRQYITTDENLYDEMISVQKELPIRKNQLFIVNEDIINTMHDEYANRISTLTEHSMIVAQDIELQPFMKFRLYNSKSMFHYCNITYENTFSLLRDMVKVAPANILMIDSMKYHRFKQVTMITDRPLAKFERYTLFKNSNNVSIADKKNLKGDV